MTTINSLAAQVMDTYGIDTLDAARAVVQVHVDQISDDAYLWDTTTDALTPAGVELVAAAIAESFAQGYHADRSQQLLDDIAEQAAAIEAAERVIEEHMTRRDEAIRAALRTELPRDAIMAAAGFTGRARLYQVRDGRR